MKRLAIYGYHQPPPRFINRFSRPYDDSSVTPFEAWAKHSGHIRGDYFAWSVMIRHTIARLRPEWDVIDEDILETKRVIIKDPQALNHMLAARRRNPVDANFVILGMGSSTRLDDRLLPPEKTIILTTEYWLSIYLHNHRQRIEPLLRYAAIYDASEYFLQKLHSLGLTNAKLIRNYRVWRPEALANVAPRTKLRRCVFYNEIYIDDIGETQTMFDAIRIVNSRRRVPITLDCYAAIDREFDVPGAFSKVCDDPNIRNMGELDGDTAVATLAEYDCMLMPTSCFFHCIGALMATGLAAGLPIIMTRMIEENEIIRDGVNGYLTAPGDANEMADRIERLAADDNLLRTMSARNLELYKQLYAEEPATRELLETIGRVMET